MNGLSLNVLTNTQQDILSLIDKVTDLELRSKLLNMCLEQKQRQLSYAPKPMQIPPRYYNIQKVFKRIEITDQPVTIQDLRNEIICLKAEVKQLKNSISL